MRMLQNVAEVPRGAVVVGVDGSDHAKAAAAWAAEEAARTRHPLVLAHTPGAPEVDWLRAWGIAPTAQDRSFTDTALRAGEALVQAAADELASAGAGPDVLGLVRIEDARTLLLDVSERAGVLVVGSRGRGPVRRLLLGSVGVALVRHAQCPLVVLRPHAPAAGNRGVVVGVAGRTVTPTVLDYAYAQADARDLPLTVVNAVPKHGMATGATYVELPPTEEQLQEHRLMVSEMLAGMRERYPDVLVGTEVAVGHPEEVLHRLGAGADLLVIGAHQQDPGAFAVTTSVVEHAHGAVAVIPVAG